MSSTTSSRIDASELLEHHVPLAAVLDERVLLRHRPKVDALAEVVHRLEMLAPARVDDLEDHVALDLAHQLGAERLLALGVRIEGIRDELLGERVATRHVDLLAELVDGDVGAVQGVHLRHQAREVPLVGRLRVGELGDVRGDHLFDPTLDLVGEVVALEHLAPLLVDDHPLRVHHVVVLEDVLA